MRPASDACRCRAIAVGFAILVLSAGVAAEAVARWVIESNDDSKQMNDEMADEYNVRKPSPSSSVVVG
jgi:hypothetical protein